MTLLRMKVDLIIVSLGQQLYTRKVPNKPGHVVTLHLCHNKGLSALGLAQYQQKRGQRLRNLCVSFLLPPPLSSLYEWNGAIKNVFSY